MAIRLSGMVSGLDTDSIVQELVSAYNTKKEKIVKSQTKLEWKQESWKTMNSKIYSFYSTSLSKMRFSSAYTTKKSTISDESIASVTAATGAVIGSQTLYISSLAKSSYLTGAKVESSSGKLSASSTLESLGITSDTTIHINVTDEENPDGKDTAITLTSDMKISDLTKALKDAGVSANFDTNNQRFYISAAKSGAAYNFDITAGDEAGVKALKSLGIYTVSDAQKDMYQQIASQDAAALKDAYREKLALAANYKTVVADIASKYESQYKDYQTLLDYQEKLAELKQKIAEETDPDEKSALETEYNQYEQEYNTLAGNRGLDNYDADNADAQKSAIEAGKKEIADKFSSITIVNGEVTLEGIKEAALQEECKTASDPAKKILAAVLGAVDEDGNIKTDAEGNIQFGSLDEEITGYASEFEAAENAYKEDIAASKSNYYMYNEMKKLLETAGSNALTESEQNTYNEFAKAVGMDSYNADSAAEALAKIDTEMTALEGKFDSITTDPNDGTLIFNEKSVDITADTIAQKSAEYSDTIDKQIAFANEQLTGNAVDASSTVKIDGQDAKIRLNGVDYTSNTNSFSINGLTITAKKVNATEDKDGNVIEGDNPVIIDTANDTEGVYNTIKEFLTQYNELINAMDAAYNAEDASSYEPLTDDEKDAMSDTEIEKWETKIKDSLLRRDSTLNSVGSAMKNAMRASIEINGKNYSLSTFGIKTLSYFTSKTNEKNAYHIDGDQEDADVSDNTDKLKAAIAEDPDAVMEFFQKLSSNLYTTLTEKMKSTTLSSAYTVYNDKQMKDEYEDYEDEIEKWEERIADMEEKYYQQFAAMETALSKLQSSTSSLTSLLGG